MNLEHLTFFRALSDPTRLRCLFLLQQEGELCVCELGFALDLVQPKISRHLALMRDSGLVLDRRAGQWIYYRINPALPEWCHQVLLFSCSDMATQALYQSDLNTLQLMPNRPGASCCA